jgi:hypothetical protein
MSIRCLKSLLAIAAAVGAAIGFSQRALALDAGKQYNADQIDQALKAEQQHVVITSNKYVNTSQKAAVAIMMMSSKQQPAIICMS